jgi:hypothetical protein
LRWVDGAAIATLLARHRSCGQTLQIVIERPRRVVGHVTKTLFESGVMFGSLVDRCHSLGHLHMVAPTWRKQVGLSANDPASALAAVNLLHPKAGLTETRHLSKANALLLADYASRFIRTPRAYMLGSISLPAEGRE